VFETLNIMPSVREENAFTRCAFLTVDRLPNLFCLHVIFSGDPISNPLLGFLPSLLRFSPVCTKKKNRQMLEAF
jgi:hypothetical protein